MSNYRSNLFIPGHTLDRLERAQNSNADAIIVDLEDGCPEAKKLVARETLISLLKEQAFTKPLLVRVNDGDLNASCSNHRNRDLGSLLDL